MKIIALEESFWYEKLATEGSTVAHVRVKSAVAADWQRRLVDFTEHRPPDMDRNGLDMQVRSLTSPGIQVQPDPGIAVADARTANDLLLCLGVWHVCGTRRSCSARQSCRLRARPKHRHRRKARGRHEELAARQCHVMVSEFLKKRELPMWRCRTLPSPRLSAGNFSARPGLDRKRVV